MAGAKLEEVKKELRSLLVSFPKGTSLSDFRKEYRSMIGRNLPFQDFGFRDEYSFLASIPDVVRVYSSPVPGDYHLMGIADESTKHIQKMVVNQKPSKHKTRYRAPREVSHAYKSAPSYASNFGSNYSRGYSRGYVQPPRFTKKELPNGVDRYVIQMLNDYPSGLRLSQFLIIFCQHYKRKFAFREWGFSTLEDCLEMIPEITARNKNNDIYVSLVKNNSEVNRPSSRASAERENISKDTMNQPAKNQSKSSVESPKLNPNAPDFIDRDFNKDGEKNKNAFTVKDDVASSHNFLIDRMIQDSQSVLEDSRYNIKDPFLSEGMIQDSHSQSVLEESRYNIKDPFLSENHVDPSISSPLSSSLKDHDNQITNKSTKADLLDDFPLSNFKEPSNNHLLCDIDNLKENCLFAFDSPLVREPKVPSASGISGIVRHNLISMINSCPHGIFAVQFSNIYEKVCGHRFDLHSLGFNNLYELVDAVPDILVRKQLKGSKKDWIIYSANSIINDAIVESGSVECSGLFIECIILNIRKILQANPEGIPISTFMHHYSINCTEPLYIRDLGFDNLEDFLQSISPRVPLEINSFQGEKVITFVSQDIIKSPVSASQKPADIASLDAKFTCYELPENFDFSKYYAVYTSSIANPGLLYIQFEGEDNYDALRILYDEMDEFYFGDVDKAYKMKPADIKPSLACVALWPSDKHWYRAIINKIISIDFVQVFYVDYATTEEIPMKFLRYIKKDYMTLPTQAVKSRLAYLMPPPECGSAWDKRIFKRMLELCQDKPLMAKVENIDKDKVLGLILCDTSSEKDLYINDVLIHEKLAVVCGEVDEPEQPVLPQDAQQLFANFLQLANSNPNFISQLQNLSLNSFPNQMPLNMASQQSLPPMYQQIPNIPPPFVNPNFNTAITSFSNNATAPIPPPKYPPGLNIQIPETTSKVTEISQLASLDPVTPLTSPDDDEIFDDEDDEYFEQWCQKNINAKKRFAKRVKTTDGYIFHMLLYDSQPYISIGDMSILIWNTRDPSYLFHKLMADEIELASIRLIENGNEEFFADLERFKVKGIEKMGNVSSILLYHFSKAIQILNLFGHPSATLRAKINSEMSTFNPSSSHWQVLSDRDVPEELEDIRIATDDDKFNRLCLYDLKIMREGIKKKRSMRVRRNEADINSTDLEEEINKLNQLYNRVRERIVEINQIITMFSQCRT